MAYTTGLLLDGWFLDKDKTAKDLLPVRERTVLEEWRHKRLDTCRWAFPDSLPEALLTVYEKLVSKSDLADWYRKSALRQSLETRTYPLQSLHIFPTGSLYSHIAALFLAQMVRGTKDVSIQEALWPNNSEMQANSPESIEICARRTWEWLQELPGAAAFNLTFCKPETLRAYRWIAALAENLLRHLVLFNWDDDIRDARGFDPLPAENNMFGNADFLYSFFDSKVPIAEQMVHKYSIFKKRLLEELESPANDMLNIVLRCWLERATEPGNKKAFTSYTNDNRFLPEPVTEE